MSEPLIAIISHAGGIEWRRAIRETWLHDKAPAYRFVLGSNVPAKCDDEITVDAPDDYFGILEKVRRVCVWAAGNGFDYLFVCFTDTYVNVARLLASGFEQHAYSGHFTNNPESAGYIPLTPDERGRFDYASGGCGYWLNREAMQLVADTEPPAEIKYDDLWVGWLLGQKGIAGFHDPRYGHHGWRLYSAQQITVHLSKGTGIFHPVWMHWAHRDSL